MLLENIASPADLRKVPLDLLPQVSSELRQRIIEVVSVTGGHLASSLGAVDLTVALHYCFNTPQDKIIWDVGHQTYAHKIITERNKAFDSLRQFRGLTGFPCKEESIYDCFTTGHSSTAVSLALGIACARDFATNSEEKFKVIAVIGDGSLSGGLCFEGLNNAGHLRKDIMVILNTNELSIAPNSGALSTYINKFISLPIYNRFKNSLESFVKSRMPKGSRIIKLANKFEEGLKGLFVPGMFFEELGFRYFGPFDGHNLPELVSTLKKLSNIKGPVLMHVITKKGKGYLPAEKDPVSFHGIGPFDIKSGEPLKKSDTGLKTYTEVFSNKIVDLAKNNKKICAITAAMPEGTGLDKFRDNFPERFFDCGIAESHSVCFAAGLSKEGYIPVIGIYSTFLQRAYDQIIEDIALQKLPIVFAVDRAGIVGEDGATHQGVFDIAYFRSIPNVVIMSPKDKVEFEEMLDFAIDLAKPVAIRYPKSVCSSTNLPFNPLVLGKAEVLKEGEDFVLIALGSMTQVAYEAVQILAGKGFSGTLINARFVKPLDVEFLKTLSLRYKFIFTIEEGVLDGGFGSAIAEVINYPVVRFGIPLEFVPCGKRSELLNVFGLTSEKIAENIRLTLINHG